MKEIVQPLIKWFNQNKRELEWRHNKTPYTILISEIMLQQTRVEAVRPYYLRFIHELPDFKALSQCSDERLLKLWEGLGYYARAKNLKACAIQIMKEYQGEFPKTYKDVIKLKGIGAYTCGAILSGAYNLPYAAVDGNVLRVLTRYQASSMDILKETTKKHFKAEIEKIIPKEAGAFNEALMELGATVCMPKVIRCDICPLKHTCKSFLENTQRLYPVKTKPKEKKIMEYTCIFVTDGIKYILIPKKDGVLKDLPSPFLIDSFLTSIEAGHFIEQLGFEVKNEESLGEKEHTFTHQKWYLKGFKILVKNLLNYPAYTESEINERLGVPTCFKQFLPNLFQ